MPNTSTMQRVWFERYQTAAAKIEKRRKVSRGIVSRELANR
jgi:hypothetical protein